MIYLSGLGEEPGSKSVEAMARLASAAFDRNATDAAAEFFVLSGEELAYEGEHKTRVVRVQRATSAGDTAPTAVLDLYDFPYQDTLRADAGRRAPIVQTLRVLGFLLANSLRIGGVWKRKSLRPDERRYVGLALAVILLVLLYFLSLFGAVAASLVTGLTPEDSPAAQTQITAPPASPAAASVPARLAAGDAGDAATNPPAAAPGAAEPPTVPAGGSAMAVAEPSDGEAISGWKRALIDWLRTVDDWFEELIVFLAAFGLLTRVTLKDLVTRLGVILVAASEYLSYGSRRDLAVGQLAHLLDFVESGGKEKKPYRRVHVLAYSFGSLVVMDSLFHNAQAAERFRAVHTLVTVGNPFDFVRTFWPNYFKARVAVPAVADGKSVPARWLNVYSEADLLGSDFDSGPESEAADASATPIPQGIRLQDGGVRRPDESIAFGPRPQDFGIVARLSFGYFRVHDAYWDADSAADLSALDPVLKKLYGNEAMML